MSIPFPSSEQESFVPSGRRYRFKEVIDSTESSAEDDDGNSGARGSQQMKSFRNDGFHQGPQLIHYEESDGDRRNVATSASRPWDSHSTSSPGSTRRAVSLSSAPPPSTRKTVKVDSLFSQVSTDRIKRTWKPKSPGGSRRGLPRVSMACQPCRIRKHKCDGKDECARCKKKGLECVWDDTSPAERRAAARELKKKGQVEEPKELEVKYRDTSDRSGLRFFSNPVPSDSRDGDGGEVRRRRITLSGSRANSTTAIPSTVTRAESNTSIINLDLNESRASLPPSPSKRARFSTLELVPTSESFPWPHDSPSRPQFQPRELSGRSRPRLTGSASWSGYKPEWSPNLTSSIISDNSSISLGSGPSPSDSPEEAEKSLLFSPLNSCQEKNLEPHFSDFQEDASNPNSLFGGSFGLDFNSSSQDYEHSASIAPPDSQSTALVTSLGSSYPTPTQFGQMSLYSPEASLSPLSFRRGSTETGPTNSNKNPMSQNSSSSSSITLSSIPHSDNYHDELARDYEDIVSYNPWKSNENTRSPSPDYHFQEQGMSTYDQIQ